MKIKSKISKESLYLIAYTLCCFVALSGSSKLIQISNILKIILYSFALLLFTYIIIKNGINKKRIILLGLMTMMSIYSFFKIDTMFFILDTFAIFALEKQNIKKIASADLAVKCFFLIIHLSYFGFAYFFNQQLLQNAIVTASNGLLRNSLFFVHPNIFSSIVFWSIVDIYFIKEKMNIKDHLISAGLVIFTYYLTHTRTIIVSYIFLLILIFLLDKGLFKRTLNFIYKYAFEIFFFAVMVIIILYKLNIGFATNFLNPLTSGRVYYMYKCFDVAGFNLISNPKILSISWLLLDNFYVRLITCYGCLYAIPLIFMTKKSKKNLDKSKIIIILFAFVLLSEYNGIIIGNSVALFVLANNYLQNRDGEYVKNKN